MSLIPSGGGNTTIELHLAGTPEFVAHAKEAEASLTALEEKTKGFSNRSKSTYNPGVGILTSGIKTLVSWAKVGAIAVAGLAVAGVALGEKLYNVGVQATAVQYKFDKVFAGTNNETLNFITDLNNKYGIGITKLQTYSAQFGVFAQSAGLAKDKVAPFSDSMVQAGLSLAAFNNADPADVFKAIQSGLAGMVRPLRQYGIFLSQTALQQQAALHGITTPVSKLSDQQKVLLRQEIIMRELGKANSALADTIDTPAAQLRMFKGRVDDLKRAIGLGLIPIFSGFITQINKHLPDALDLVNRNMPKFQAFMSNAIDNSITSFQDLWDVVSGGSTTSLTVAKDIDKLFGANGSLTRPLQQTIDIGQNLWDFLKNGLGPAFAQVGKDIASLDPLEKIKDITGFMSDHAQFLAKVMPPVIDLFLTYTAVMWGVTAATRAWNAALEANPLVIFISGVILAEIWLARHHRTWHFLKQDVKDFQAAVHALSKAWDWVKGVGTTINNDIFKPVERVKNFIDNWADKTFISPFNKIFNWGNIKSDFDDDWRHIKSWIGDIQSLFSNAWDGAFDGLKTAFEWVINKIIAGWDALQFQLPSYGGLHVAGHTIIPGWTGPTLGVPQIDPIHLAMGGTVTAGGLAEVGEHGREILHLPPAASVVPLPKSQNLSGLLQSMANGGGDKPVSLIVYIGGKQVQAVVKQVTADEAARR